MPPDGPTCGLEVVEVQADGLSLDAIGVLLGGVSRERARQIESNALVKLERRLRRAAEGRP